MEALEALGRKAIAAGCRVEHWRDNDQMRRLLKWDVSGGCISAVFVENHARYSAQHGKRVKPLTIVLETRCRKCGWCRDQRRNFWAVRARNEFRQSARTWFLTLTMEPDIQFRFLNAARVRLARQGVDFDGLPEVEKFSERVREAGREVTAFVKRVRKNSRAHLRYLLVAEAHQSGAPHFHMLIHEVSPDSPVRKAQLQAAWTVGYSKAVLCDDPRGAVYLCKYLAKDARSRVRASFRYGLQDPSSRDIANESAA